ncbi:hypothetical protein SDC9_90941 [bioreactor metagenome]|uniref:Uncharacterized protein n=1 Tax=bioreactor metagenome TaxID=1076179 RepID=A0A645A084_9ZZZZ
MLLRRGHDILKDRRSREETEVLEGTGDAEADHLVCFELIEALPLEADRAAGHVINARDEVEDRRLARAVRSDKPGQFAASYRKAHIADGLNSAECLVHIFKFKYGGRHQRAPSSAASVFLFLEKSFLMYERVSSLVPMMPSGRSTITSTSTSP